jgi:hypothetical protein
MANKFVRGLNFTTGSTTARISYVLKIMYEFWGFCVFGGASTTSPGTGAFAATTPTGGGLPGNFLGVGTTIAAGSNGASLPQATINVVSTTGFPTSGTIFVYTSLGTQIVTYTGINATQFTGCSGGLGTMSTGGNVTSSSLMTVGTDGYTNASTQWRADGYTDFYANSGPFTASMIGKQLVTWKSSSNSSEDSIYNIIAFKSPNNIVINVNSGGVPSSENDGYRPSVTTRSSINYRVVDVGVAGAFTGVTDGNYIVFQFDPTGINAGQANPQLQFLIANGVGTNTKLDYRMSPNGSWTGAAFGGDASGVLTPNSASGNAAYQLQSTTSAGNVTITLVGDKHFMLGYSKDSNHSSSAGFHWHIEIPDRLYTQAQDTNPFAAQINGYNHVTLVPINAASYSGNTTSNNTYMGGFVMRCNDGVYRHHRVITRALIGDGGVNLISSAYNIQQPPGPFLTDIRVGANTETGGLLASYAFLGSPRDSSGNPVVGQYSLARCRLRNVRFSNNFMTRFTRFNYGGNFILLTHGVAWPWDNSVIPITLFPY